MTDPSCAALYELNKNQLLKCHKHRGHVGNHIFYVEWEDKDSY